MEIYKTITGIASDIERELNNLNQDNIVTVLSMTSYQGGLCVLVGLREFKVITSKDK